MSAAESPSHDVLFIVFSDDWGVHMSSAQHLFCRIARRHPVAWINTVGMRGPTLSWNDVKKAQRKLGGMLKRAQSDSPKQGATPVTVYQPAMVPWSGPAAFRCFNRNSVRRAMRDAVARSSTQRVIVVSTVPNACDYVDALDGVEVIYYCVDDFSEWPGLDRDLILTMEQALLAKTDFCFATSTRLFSRLSASGVPTVRLDHGVDLEFFATEGSREHELLRAIPGRRIGFFGLFDDRFDKELIAALARRLPDVAIVLAGQIETDVTDLRRIGNIHFVGPVAYGELPEFIHGMLALIMPYHLNELAKSLSPLKLKEYLATGRPVIGTPIPAIREFGNRIMVAANIDEWEDAVRAAMTQDIEERRRSETALLASESWDAKAATFEATLLERAVLPASDGKSQRKEA